MVRVFRHYLPAGLLWGAVTELVLLLLALPVSVLMCWIPAFGTIAGAPPIEALPLAATGFALSLLGGLIATGCYQRDTRDLPLQLAWRVLLGVSAGLLIFLLLHRWFANSPLPLAMLALAGTLALIGIASNSVLTHPQDGPEGLRHQARTHGWTFPYLFDADQTVARAFQAACTPDPFLFDADHRLVYRGQIDGSRPGNAVPCDGRDLRAAIEAVLAGQAVNPEQRPSIGCNIKWHPEAA